MLIRKCSSVVLLTAAVFLSLAFVIRPENSALTMECKVFVPNVFTPNDDGVNDSFAPAFGCPVVEYEMAIYNRWGKRIYVTTNPDNGWNGRIDGELQSQDVYVYCVLYSMDGDTTQLGRQQLVGDVMLMR